MNNRIKHLRAILNLTQEAFGAQIGIKKASVSTIESGKTNPSDQTILLICREFNVREDWLLKGEGPIFQPEDTYSLDQLVKDHGGTDLELRIIKAYFELSPELRKLVLDHFQRSLATDATDRSVEDLEQEYKKTCLEPSAAKASASNTTKDTSSKAAGN